jgi:hypothetical protein
MAPRHGRESLASAVPVDYGFPGLLDSGRAFIEAVAIGTVGYVCLPA